MRVLVVGGTGFVGRQVMRELKRRSIDALAVSRSSGSDIQWDATRPYGKRLDGYTDVVHCMGSLLDHSGYKQLLGKSKSSFASGDAYNKINRQSIVNVLDAVRDLPLRNFVFVSASEQLLPFPFNEMLRNSQGDTYMKSKLDAEMSLVEWDGSFNKIIVRPGFIYDEAGPIPQVLSLMRQVKLGMPAAVQQVLPAAVAQPTQVQRLATTIVDALMKEPQQLIEYL